MTISVIFLKMNIIYFDITILKIIEKTSHGYYLAFCSEYVYNILTIILLMSVKGCTLYLNKISKIIEFSISFLKISLLYISPLCTLTIKSIIPVYQYGIC